MSDLRQPKNRVIAGQSSSTSSWCRCDLVCGAYLLLVLVAFTLTGIALARGDLPSDKIPQQIASN